MREIYECNIIIMNHTDIPIRAKIVDKKQNIIIHLYEATTKEGNS